MERQLTQLCAFKTQSVSPIVKLISDKKDIPSLIHEHPQHIVMGEGTNTLFVEDINVPVFRNAIMEINQIFDDDEKIILSVGGGENWSCFVDECCKNDLWGVERLAGIPGTVGAAPVKNIGAYGSELKDIFHSAHVYDIEEKVFKDMKRDECGFGYRNSIFSRQPDRYIIAGVTLILNKKSDISSDEYMEKLANRDVSKPFKFTPRGIADAILNRRKKKLPSVERTPNAGSFFKNPIIGKAKAHSILKKHPNITHWEIDDSVKFSAGHMVDICGLKGYRDPSGAGVSGKHALVIVNNGGATGADIYKLSCLVSDRVRDMFDIQLEREVIVHGL